LESRANSSHFLRATNAGGSCYYHDGVDYRSYFLPCDGHWSAKGNEVAAQILEPWLGEKK